MLELPTADLFSPHIDQPFQVGDTELFVTLVQVEAATAAPVGQHAPFTLIFRGPKSPWAPENMWRLKGPDGVAHELYMSPIQTSSPERQDYQVVFN